MNPPRATIELLEPRLLLDAAQAAQLLSALPAVFVENLGQWDDAAVRYAYQGPSGNVLLTDDGPVFQLFQPADDGTTDYASFAVHFDGASPISPQGLDALAAEFNYYLGACQAQGAAGYQTAAYRGLWDGIDLYAWGQGKSLKYEFHVAPQADYTRIGLTYEGVDSLRLDGGGALHVGTPLGELVDDAPLIYQDLADGRHEVAGRFRLIDSDTVGFDITGAFDASGPLVIDPDLIWSTFLGGSGTDESYGIDVADDGTMVIAGRTWSTNFPRTSGLRDLKGPGTADAFVSKFTSFGTLVWSTYYGGRGNDYGRSVAVDPGSPGYVFFTGATSSDDLPLVTWPTLTGYVANGDAFVARLNNNGYLSWTVYLGGSLDDAGLDIALDPDGNPVVAGYTGSDDFPVTYGSEDYAYILNRGYSAFVTKVARNGGGLIWSTYLGGTDYDAASGVTVGSDGRVYVTGYTASVNFQHFSAFDTSHNGGYDVFVAGFAKDETGLLDFSGFLGHSGDEFAFDIAVDDATGKIYVTGDTDSDSFPTTTGAYDRTANGGVDAFVACMSYTGSSLSLNWSTRYGGNDDDTAYGIDVDEYGNALIVGTTWSSNLPTTLFAFDRTYNDDGVGAATPDAFVARIAGTGAALDWATYVGTTGSDYGRSISVNTAGHALITGHTDSALFPVTDGVQDTSHNGGMDAYVAKFRPVTETFDLTTPAGTDQVQQGSGFRLEWNGGGVNTLLDLLAFGPTGWHQIAGDVPASDGYWDWGTAAAPPGWYWFATDVIEADYATRVLGDGWLEVTAAPPPAPAGLAAAEGPEAAALPLAPTVSGVDQGRRSSHGYAWTYKYHLTMTPGSQVLIDLYIQLTGTSVNSTTLGRWEQGIEQTWGGQYTVVDAGPGGPMPIVFDCHFVSSGGDHVIEVHPGSGRSDMLNWYVNDNGTTAAHEAGHMFGLWDEYSGGAVDPVNPIYDFSSVMGGPYRTVYARHYQGIETWLEAQTGRSMALAPFVLGPAVASLTADPDPANGADVVTLTAEGPDLLGAAARVEFYLDADGDGALNAAADRLLGTDLDGADGWTWSGPAGDLPVGADTFFARAANLGGAWGASAAVTAQISHALPDLTAHFDFFTFPASGDGGEVVSVPVIVRNIGQARAAGDITIDLYASIDQLRGGDIMLCRCDAYALDLAPGQQTTLAVELVLPGDLGAPGPGNYYILADVDSQNQVAESNESNNLAASSAAFHFSGSPGVELTSPAAPEQVRRGDTYEIRWTGGTGQENLDLWRFGPQGWTLMAAGLSGGTCAYEWDTNDVGEGWYFFRMSGASGSGQGGLAGSNSGWLQLRAPPPPYTAAGTPTVAPLPPAWQAAGKGREFVGMEGMQGIKEDLLPSSSSSSSSFSSSLASPVSLLIFASQARQAALLPAVEWPAAGSDPEGTFDLDALRRFGPVLDLL